MLVEFPGNLTSDLRLLWIVRPNGGLVLRTAVAVAISLLQHPAHQILVSDDARVERHPHRFGVAIA